MSRSKKALTNDVLNHAAHLLSDVGILRGVPPESVETTGFSGFSKLFCDSIIFWGLYNRKREDIKGTTIGNMSQNYETRSTNRRWKWTLLS